jgi:hypothetical protein
MMDFTAQAATVTKKCKGNKNFHGKVAIFAQRALANSQHAILA